MKRTVLKLMALFAVVSMSCVNGQTGPTLVADVPFGFYIGKQLLPAGEYQIVQNTGNASVLIRGEHSKATRLALTHACKRNWAAREGQLVFKRYGNTYFLSKIWTPGNDYGRELMPSAAEREIARSVKNRELTSVHARVR